MNIYYQNFRIILKKSIYSLIYTLLVIIFHYNDSYAEFKINIPGQRPGGLPQCIGKNDIGNNSISTVNIVADGYYENLNDNIVRYDKLTAANYNQWYDTGVSISAGQDFAITVQGEVSKLQSTIIDFRPNTHKDQRSGIKFTSGDSIQLLISNIKSDGRDAENYVNLGGFTIDSCSPKSPGGCCGENCWSMNGSGIYINIDSLLINNPQLTFAKNGTFPSTLGKGLFFENGFYADLTLGGELVFQAVDYCDEPYECYTNNLGSYSFLISRKYSKYNVYNSKRNMYGSLDYTVGTNINNKNASSLNIFNISSKEIGKNSSYTTTSKDSGTLWLRIHDDDLTSYNNISYKTVPLSNGNNIKVPLNRTTNVGNYYVSIQTNHASNNVSNLIDKVTTPVKKFVKEASFNYYDRIISNPSFTNFIKLSIVLYIIIYACSFMFGIVEVTQQDLVLRIVKMGVLFGLIATQTSWKLFNENFLNLFLDGANYILLSITGDSPDSSSGGLFRFIDYSLNTFFTKNTWIKISSLVISDALYSLVCGVLIIYGIVIYLVTMFNLIISYLISIIVVGFMIAIAPLFIACILFERTKTYFDNWLKFLFNFSLQPIMLFGCVYLVFDMVIASAELALNFKTCWEDKFSFTIENLVEFNFRYFNVVTDAGSFQSVFSTDKVNFYVNLLFAVIRFIIFIKIFKHMLDFAPEITGVITSTTSALVNLSGKNSKSSEAIKQFTDKIRKATKTDEKSINNAKKAISSSAKGGDGASGGASRGGAGGGKV